MRRTTVRWAPGRAMVYRAANGWILLVPRGGRWQEVVVVVVVVAGRRRHLVVVVVAASLLQSPASSAGGRHLVCLPLPGATRDDYCSRSRCGHVERKSCELRETEVIPSSGFCEAMGKGGVGGGEWRRREGLLSTLVTNVSKTLFNQEFDYILVKYKKSNNCSSKICFLILKYN